MIKAGQIVLVGGDTIIRRAQGGGPTSLNIAETKVNELGSDLSIATIRDIPDLTFELTSWDMTTEAEALVTRVDFGAVSDGDAFDFTDAKPLDITSPWKRKKGSSVTDRGLALPYLTLERAQYRFGVRASAEQTFTLRGDSYYWVQGTPYHHTFPGAGAGPYAYPNAPGLKTVEDGDDVYAYCVTVYYADGTWKRLVHGSDFTDTAAHVTISDALLAPVGSEVEIVYGSATTGDFPDSLQIANTLKPAAIRGRDIDVYISNGAATPTFLRWNGVQSIEASWSVTLQNIEELGNRHYVESDYDVPAVAGNVALLAPNPIDLFNKMAQVAGVDPGDTVNALSAVPLEVEMRIHHPETGAPIKTIYVPDARFQLPPFNPRVGGQAVDVTLPFTSDSGAMTVYAGARP